MRLNADHVPGDLPWTGRRWIEGVRGAATEAAFEQGLEYARLGQTRSIEVTLSHIAATVQGRRPSAYKTSIRIDPIPADAWDGAISAIADQAVFSARLLAGELPEEAEGVIAQQGVSLFPSPDQMHVSCTCREPGPWCKHACCAALLVADLFERDAFLVFTLRGLSGGELLERIRRARVAGTGASGVSPRQGGPVELDTRSGPLEESLDDFWEAGPGLDLIETPIRKPEVSHPLLRRLGPSPLEGRFPLVGLLATCYDAISNAAIRRASAQDEPGARDGTGE